MPRPFRTAVTLSLCTLVFTGCSTLYRPIYSPGKSNYRKPPEKRDSAELLLNAPTDGAPNTAPVPGPDAGLPMLDGAPGAAPAMDGGAAPMIPGLEPAPAAGAPAIPGLPNP